MNPTPENDTPLTDAAIAKIMDLIHEAHHCEIAEDLLELAELERDRKRLRDSIIAVKSATKPMKQWEAALRVEYALKESLALDAKLLKETK